MSCIIYLFITSDLHSLLESNHKVQEENGASNEETIENKNKIIYRTGKQERTAVNGKTTCMYWYTKLSAGKK